MTPFRLARLVMFAATCAAQLGFGVRSPAYAEIGSDRPAAILVFPKILVDTQTPPSTPRGRIDTLIRVTNTADRPIAMQCYYVNANGHCRAARNTICDPYDLDAVNLCAPDDPCLAGWEETDFIVNLTPGQPTAWIASQGSTRCELSSDPNAPCFPLPENQENRVPPVSENPFIGYMKCIAVDRNETPIDHNDLIGDVQLVRSNDDELDIEEYNAIGIPAIPSAVNPDKRLVIGGSPVCDAGDRRGVACASDDDCPASECLTPEYESCPNILIMDHIFEGANDPISGETVTTILTLVPCSDDFETQSPIGGPIQFLVFNEFEQRFSTSQSINCFHEFRLPDIQGRTEVRSIFSAAVNGTLTGQTRMRGVVGEDGRVGYTWLGVVEEFREGGGSAAFNLHFQGTRPEADFIHVP